MAVTLSPLSGGVSRLLLGLGWRNTRPSIMSILDGCHWLTLRMPRHAEPIVYTDKVFAMHGEDIRILNVSFMTPPHIHPPCFGWQLPVSVLDTGRVAIYAKVIPPVEQTRAAPIWSLRKEESMFH